MKIIYADMVADLFHRGHLEFLRKIKTMYPCSYLIIGIHSDESVESYKRKPIFSMDDRAAIVEACKFVDEVIKDAPLTVTKVFVEKHHIDIIVHGDDTNYIFSEFYKDPIEMGIMKLIPYYDGISTSDIIKEIKKR